MKKLEQLSKVKAAGSLLKRKNSQSSSSFYKEVCSKLNITVNSAIFSALRTKDLTLNVDSLLPADVNAMRAVLLECSFPTITLNGAREFNAQGFYEDHEQALQNYRTGSLSTNTESSENIQAKSNQQQMKSSSISSSRVTRSTPSDNPKSKQKPQFSQVSPKDFMTFMEIIGNHIARTSNPLSNPPLTCLKIVNLSLTPQSLGGICGGLQKSSTVKELYIQNCGVTSEIIEKGMIPFMTKIKSLILLDLSFNKLDGHSGGLIGKLLSSHSLNRDETVWLCGLRGEVPENDVNLDGICEINLTGNYLNDRSVRELCQFLQFDGWTRSINLRYNRIGCDGLVELNTMLDNNENLISLDIRNNPGMAPSPLDFQRYGEAISGISKTIYDKLLRNIQIFKQNRDSLRRKQQEQIIANIQYGNNNQPVQLIYADTNHQQHQPMHYEVNNNPEGQNENVARYQLQQGEEDQEGQMYYQDQYQGQANEGGEEEYNDYEVVGQESNTQLNQHDDGQEEGEEEQDIELTEEQQYILSEEFFQQQQAQFEQLYCQNEQFFELKEEDQQTVFQQFFFEQQRQFLIEIDQQAKQMEGVEEVQEQFEDEENQANQQEGDGEEYTQIEHQYHHQQHHNQQQQVLASENHDYINQPELNDHEDQSETQLEVPAQLLYNENQLHQNAYGEQEEEHQERKSEQDEGQEEEEQQMQAVMEQLYEELGLEQIVNKQCEGCLQLQGKLMQSEYEKLNLLMQLKNMQPIEEAAGEESVAESYSVQANNGGNYVSQSPSNSQQAAVNAVATAGENGALMNSDGMHNRIESLMSELTRLMDNLETIQNNTATNNNITYQLSNTSNTQNQTHQLLGLAQNQNFNNTFSNFLGGASQNHSNILSNGSAFQNSHQRPQSAASTQKKHKKRTGQAKTRKYDVAQQNQILLQQQNILQQQQLHWEQIQLQQNSIPITAEEYAYLQQQQQQQQMQHPQQAIYTTTVPHQPLQQNFLQQKALKSKKTNKK